MLYDIALNIGYNEAVVIEEVSVDDFPYIMPLIDKMKYMYDRKEKNISIEIKRVGNNAYGKNFD